VSQGWAPVSQKSLDTTVAGDAGIGQDGMHVRSNVVGEGRLPEGEGWVTKGHPGTKPNGLWDELPECSGSAHRLSLLCSSTKFKFWKHLIN
jgi:hypothetical protein